MNAALGAQQAESGGTTGLGRVLEPGVIDVSHGPILYLEDVTVQLRWLSRAQPAYAVDRPRRTALRDRSQWRGKDHDDGRDHRQDRAAQCQCERAASSSGKAST
ncbi:hypothetical protein ACU4HD_13485 [Cupriavidus basilensis]